jgi:glycosyltransferase involved in cell wall biosynthesis
MVFENNWLVHNAVRKADATGAAANFLAHKSLKLYKLKKKPGFLPTPVSMPDPAEKAMTPTVCFLARWDRRKKPERFFELAKHFPHVTFLAAGKSRDPKYDAHLRETYQHFANIKMTGFIDQFKEAGLSEVLGPSWILVNTATREGLPNSFIEAAAHKCAIVSEVDPDGFSSKFGYHVQNGDFVRALEYMLQNNRWHSCGQRGHEYVSSEFHADIAIQKHMDLYRYVIN